MSSVGPARLVSALSFGRVVLVNWDDGISSSASERFFCGDLFMIGEIGGGLSLISANKAMIWFFAEFFFPCGL